MKNWKHSGWPPDEQPIEVEINRVYKAEAAHRLPDLPVGHKCGNLHGHSYKITVSISDRRKSDWQTVWMDDQCYPWILDFAELDDLFKPYIDRWLDHDYLNDSVTPYPTSENLAAILLYDLTNLLSEHYPTLRLNRVTVSETDRSSATASWTT